MAVAIVSLSMLAGCGDDARSEASGAGETPSGLPVTLQEFAADTLFTIGAAQGESWQAFAGIWDVDVSPSGQIAVLDIDTGQVHVFDESGAHIGSIDTPGLEPGGLDAPAGVAWRSADNLLVWDAGASWISRFAVGTSGISFEERWRAYAFGETGFCATGGRMYLSYWQDSLVVHEIAPEGVARSFGAAPEIPGMSALGAELQEIAVEELSPSGLLCTPAGVLDVAFFGAHLRFHDPDGALVWERDFEDFKTLAVYTPDGVGLGKQFDAEQGTPLLHSLVSWGDEAALVQHEIRTREFPEEGEIPVIESRLIRLTDGVELDRTRELPRVLATWGRRLYLLMNEPFPRIVVIESNGQGG